MAGGCVGNAVFEVVDGKLAGRQSFQAGKLFPDVGCLVGCQRLGRHIHRDVEAEAVESRACYRRRHGGQHGYLGERRAVRERKAVDACHTAANNDTAKGETVHEGTGADGDHAVGNDNLSEGRTLGKGMVRDNGEACGQRHFDQGPTAFKSIGQYVCHAVGDGIGLSGSGNGIHDKPGLVFVEQDALLRAEGGVARRYVDVCKT